MVEKQVSSTAHNHFTDVKLFKEQELGRGSFATVYQAQCDDLPCAAKVLHADFFDQQYPNPDEQTFISKFVEECKILPSIAHPNIVQCFGMYQDPDTDLPVLLMELMDESLTNFIERFSHPLPYHIEISFSYDVALGLSYLHSRGFIHRDLSSNNVLIMAGIRAKITDFGTCTGVSRQTRLTLCPGTQAFMPPEALLEPPVYTDKLDIFTLGVVMIQIMSRQYPDPGPAHKKLPSSMLVQVIPEEERRSNHIKLIRCDHPMLPLAKQCIQNLEDERPLCHNVCSDLRSFKESCEYQQSKEANVEHKLERESQLHQLQLTKIMMEMEDKIETLKAEHSRKIESIHHQHKRELQLIKMRTEMQDKIEIMKVEHSRQLEYQRDNQNFFSNGRCTPASDVQGDQLDHWHQPPPSPLLHLNSPPVQQPSIPTVPQNSKEKNTKHIYNVVPDAKGVLIPIPFDPSDLPDPVFDTHDLEMFHQEARYIDDIDPYTSSNMSLFINPHSDDFGEYYGPNLDDHLAYRSHDSGHMGLSESPAGSAIGKTAEEKNESEQQLLEKETEQEDTCRSGSHLVHMPGNTKEQRLLEEKSKQEDTYISGSHLVRISSDVPRIKEANYSDVILKEKDKSSSSALFQVGDYTSVDSQPPSIYSQSTHQTAPPVTQPRSFSWREEKLSRHTSEGSLLTAISGAGHPRPPIPRPRSDNNLPSMKGSQGLGTPPGIPSRNKPAIAPRMARSRINESGTALGNIQTSNRNVSAEDESASDAICVSQPLPLIPESLTIDDGATTSTSHVTSMESNFSDNLHSEAHTSLDSGSPHPSLESMPSMSNKPDPCPSTPAEKAHSVYSGQKKLLVDVESCLDPSWIKVDLTVDKKDSKDDLSSLETQPRPRVSDKSQKAKPSKSTPREEAYYDPPIHTDIQYAIPCWHCTNLTTLEICDVCGNEQHRKATI